LTGAGFNNLLGWDLVFNRANQRLKKKGAAVQTGRPKSKGGNAQNLGSGSTPMMPIPHCKNMSLRRTNFKTLTSINEIFAVPDAYLQHRAVNAVIAGAATPLVTAQHMI